MTFALHDVVLAARPTAQSNCIEFDGLELPESSRDKRVTRVSKKVRVTDSQGDIETTHIEFIPLFETGKKDGNEIWGQMKDREGNAIPGYLCSGRSNGVSLGSGTDFSAILNHGNKIYLMSQFECPAGGMYMAELEQSDEGRLTAIPGTLRHIDQSAHFGGWTHCAGTVTAWNTYLGGEEYEPDAGDENIAKDPFWRNYKAYYWNDSENANPYMVGYITETSFNNDGEPVFRKHYAMGRFSHELAYVMPDRKTAYLTDDATNGSLFMFVAQNETDFSSGTLYVAKWTSEGGRDGNSGKLTWINLGAANDQDIKDEISRGARFTELFEESDPKTCRTENGFRLVAPNGRLQCLKVRIDKHKLASRLESRRYAAVMGATHEFRKMEGFTYDNKRNVAYMAISEAARGMLNNTNDPELKTRNARTNRGDIENYDFNGATGNHIRLEHPNYCGGVYALAMGSDIDDTSGDRIKSGYVAVDMQPLLMGGSSSASNNDDGKQSCASNSPDSIAQPDNIAFLPHSDTLLIGEDSRHENNMLWAYNVVEKRLTRIATVPLGAEATSPYWNLDINGYSYISLVIQHAGDKHTAQSVTGYIGPISGLVK